MCNSVPNYELIRHLNYELLSCIYRVGGYQITCIVRVELCMIEYEYSVLYTQESVCGRYRTPHDLKLTPCDLGSYGIT